MTHTPGVGDFVRFTEVAFFHKRSRSLLLTDAVIFVPEDPPECIPVDALLSCARDGPLARFVAGGASAEEVMAVVIDTCLYLWVRMGLEAQERQRGGGAAPTAPAAACAGHARPG